MRFIGDQGWFYLSARNMILYHSIPLVGITASHTWLHQSAFWTYLLSATLFLFHFQVVGGVYLTVFFGLLTLWLIYYVGTHFFSQKAGLIAVFLYATSPLIIENDRFAYHTSIIPFFTLLFIFSLYQWIKINRLWFGAVLCSLTVLYNFELATSLLWGVCFVVLFYGVIKKENWVRFDKKEIFIALIGFVVQLIPFILYDVNHRFPQTVKFVVWMLYRIGTFFGLKPLHAQVDHTSIFDLLSFLANTNAKLFFAQNAAIALVLTALGLGMYAFLLKKLSKDQILAALFLLIVFVVCLLGFLLNKTVSDAFWPLFFPVIVLFLAESTAYLMQSIKKQHFYCCLLSV